MTPIRKGSNPVKIPFAIKSNDRTFAAWANEVVTAIRQLEARVPTANVGRGSAATSSQFKVSIRLDGATYKVKVRPGYVRTINPDSAATEPVKDWMPTMGGTALDDDTAPEMTVTDGQTVYCRVTTTAKGVITTAPTIVAADTPEAGVHFQPPSASITGDLYLPIADVSITGSPVVVTITQVQQGGPIVVTPNLPELKNIGSKRELVSARTPAGDTYDIRTLEQLITSGAAEIIKPLVGAEGNTIPFRNIRKNNSGSTPYNITGTGDSVDFQFTGTGDTFTDLDGGIVAHVDGFATSVTPPPFTVEDFDIEIWGKHFTVDFTAEDVTSADGTAATAVLYVRKGRVYRTNPDTGSPPARPVFKIYESSVST